MVDDDGDSEIEEICTVTLKSPEKCLELSGDTDKDSSPAPTITKKKKKTTRLKLRRKTRKSIFVLHTNVM